MEPMQITITGTKVAITGDKIIGFQLNNLVNRFEATTDKDDTWQYTLYVYMIKPEKYNVINLNRQQDTNIIYVDLTADMMPFDGRYEMQFVANQYDTGEVFRTEKFQVWVENSIDPSKEWDPIPSEFYQIEENIQKIYQDTKQLYDEIQEGTVFNVEAINGGNAFKKNNIKELV